MDDWKWRSPLQHSACAGVPGRRRRAGKEVFLWRTVQRRVDDSILQRTESDVAEQRSLEWSWYQLLAQQLNRPEFRQGLQFSDGSLPGQYAQDRTGGIQGLLLI